MPLSDSEWEHFQNGAAKNKFHHWAHCKHCLKAGLSKEESKVAGTKDSMQTHLRKCDNFKLKCI